MSFRKGSRLDGVAGNVFVVLMLLMASSASILAYVKHETNNFFGGIVTFLGPAFEIQRPPPLINFCLSTSEVPL